MALNNKGQQNNTNQVFIDETQMSYNSKQSGKSIVEVRPQKSITFNPIDQGFNSEQQQFQAKSIEKDDQNYPSKQQKISSNEKQKNQTNILPSVRQNNLLLSPHSEEINQLLSRQNLVFSSNNNSFQNSIYYGSSNNQKSDMEQQQADFSSSGKNTIPKARVDMKELNNMLENQNFQKSQFNLPPQNQRANDKGKATNNQQLPQAICLLDKQYQNEAKNGSKNFKNGQILNQNQNQNQTKISIDFTQFQELQNSQINGQTTTQNYFHSIIPDPNQPTTNSRKKINDVNSNIHPNTQKGLDFQDIDINSKTDLRSPKSELHQTIHFENSSNGKRPSLDGKTNLNQFSKQRESSNNQKLREMDQTNLPFSDEISMHLHKLLKSQNELITQEILKITTILVASLIIEVLQIIRRFQYNEYLLFITLAFTCLGLEIISTASILAYLRTFNLQIIQQNHLKKIVFFLLVQLFRCIVFTNNFLKFDQENSALEVVIELFFIQLIIRQVLPNFKIFRMKDKLILIDMIVYALAGILCLNYEYDHIYNQIVQWGILILSFLIIQFKFNYFPFHLTICNKINVYDPQNNNYLLRKRSYFSQKVIESCYTDQLYMIKSNIKNPNLKSGNDTINNLDHKINYSVKQTQNQTWNQQQKEPQQQNNTQVFELSSRQEAENMLKDSVQYALLDDKAQSMYVSKQVIPQMMTIFAKKDKVNIFAETLPAELGHASPSDFTTIPRQKSQQNLNQINLIRLFDSFLENIIIERVDIDTMSMWENFKKQNQVKNLQGQQIQDSTSQYFSKKQIFNQDNQYLCQPFNSKQLQISQENPLPLSPAPSTFKDIIHARNLNLSQNKVSSSAITTTYNIAYSYKIGLKSQNIMISLKEFLVKISTNWDFFKKHYKNKPIIIASLTTEDQLLDLQEIKKYQIKIYPQTPKLLEEMLESQSLHMTTSKKFQKENDQDKRDNPQNFLLVFEEIHQREKIVNKSQFYQILKNLFRCFNNDLTQSLSNIIATSSAGIKHLKLDENIKDKFLRPIQLSCRIIKYILHNLRDFNDLVGERFILHIVETPITQVVEHCIMLFKQTSDRNIKFIVDYDQDTPLVISTDTRRLIQIIITLLSNAHKHTQTGYLKFRIYPPSRKGVLQKNIIRFQVEDTGEGMDLSIQQRLNKLLNSGIGYQDFKQISSFGFNLFICNIIAKKLYNPEYTYYLTKENELNPENNEASGIKFSSVPHRGSQFYFDIKIIDEKKSEKIQDSLMNYSNTGYISQEQNNYKSVFANKNYSIVQFAQPPTNSLQVDDQNNQYQSNLQKNNMNSQNQKQLNGLSAENGVTALNTQNNVSMANQVQTKTGNNDCLDISEEIQGQIQKNQVKFMTFQKQPQGLHSHYKFLKCQCKNVLILDKIYRNLDTIEMILTNFNFLPQRCCSIKEAITLCEEKRNNDCKICGENQFICVFVCTDEFQKQDISGFIKDLESFVNDYCKNSIVFAISSFTTKTRKILENIRIDDFISNPFDSIELQHLIDNWKLLPISQSSRIGNSSKILHVSV